MNIKNIAYNFLIRYRINNLNFDFELLKEIALSNGWELCPYSSNKNLIFFFKVGKEYGARRIYVYF